MNMNYNKYHRPNFCYLSSTAEGLKKGLWYFLFKVLQDYSQYDNTCILLHLKYFLAIITKNVLLSSYFTTDLYHRMTHTATSPPRPSSGYFKGNCLILKR